MDPTEKRKEEHIMRALKEESEYAGSSGLEHIEPLHNSLPEVDFAKVDTKTETWGRRFGAPLLITGMTGGYAKAEEINKALAIAAEKHNIPFGLGSMRAMIEKPGLTKTYDVKKAAKELFLIGNMGAFQLKQYSTDKIASIVSKLELDALAIHLNPLQEMVQPEGDKDWSGVIRAIEKHVDKLDVPVIVKETGAGISPSVIERLKPIGIEWFDISGKGGTSWSKIEYMRGGSIVGFEEWGLSTAEALILCKSKARLIASGGIRNGIDGAKALMMGAELFGAARPFLLAWKDKAISQTIDAWIQQLKGVMFLTGSKDITNFKKAPYLINGPLRELILVEKD
jgi:isopentenyl-diphosphate delta-isomerase